MAAAALESKEIWGDEADELDDEIMKMSSDDIRQRARMIDNDIRIMKSEMQRIRHESESQREKIKENHDKIKLNKQLPYLVGNVVEILDLKPEVCVDSCSHRTPVTRSDRDPERGEVFPLSDPDL